MKTILIYYVYNKACRKWTLKCGWIEIINDKIFTALYYEDHYLGVIISFLYIMAGEKLRGSDDIQ